MLIKTLSCDSLSDGLARGLRRPCDALYDVVVVPQLRPALLGAGDPDADALVVGAGGEQVAGARADPHHPDPVAVALVGLDAEAGGHLPHLDRLVPGAAEDVVAGRDEADAGDVVVVALQGLGALVAVEVPQLHRHVGGARHQQLARVVERNVLRNT